MNSQEHLVELPDSPYQKVFESIEVTPDCTTIQAYSLFYNRLSHSELDPSIYLSMAITSGGYARDPELTYGDILAKNGHYGSLVAETLSKQFVNIGILPTDILVPSDLGKVAGWSQADYLLFWAHVITGLDPYEAEQVDAAIHEAGTTKHAGFFNKQLPRDERWLAYKQLVDVYVEQFSILELGRGNSGAALPQNMQAVILALDPQESLGVNAERYLCHKLGLGEYVTQIKDVDNSAFKVVSDALASLGAHGLPAGSGDISGSINWDAHWHLRRQGVRFRQSGLLNGIVNRKMAVFTPIPPETRSSQELWEDYYAHEVDREP